ncbi:thiol reductant ABC exporter subunit CydD [Paenarthrobacter sp. DKR-5]|uniref:thiol reductant ABC exporter subunit CydD n=1 Tax=Paenarthrobacter sp. DKR-5 TaxID=2835535 RepID=UPI001BDDABAA|nr:thiol reductant ABC exporter subunit CydD [Paenarthrobacter sp. DKR-5]MBT1002101.1 thiol reductant ABC exporter subunit CydD [Paenarthrobacter sp. DKR-5]
MRPQLPPAGPARRALYLLGLLSALRACAIVVLAQAVASAVVSIIAADGRWQQSLTAGAAAVVVRAALAWAQQVTARRTAAGAKERLRAELLDHLVGRGRNAGGGEGSISVLAVRGLDAVDNYYTQFLPALVAAATVPLIIGARILWADWLSALVIVLTVPLIPLFMALIGWHTQERVEQASASLARLSNHLVELAKGLPVLVGLGRAGAQSRALRRVSEDCRTRTLATLRVAFLSALALELIATLSVAVVAVVIGVRLVNGQLPLEVGLLALILAPECYGPLRDVGSAFHASEDGIGAFRRVQELTGAPLPAPLTGTVAPAAAAPEVTVRDLTVRFPGRSQPALAGFSLTARAGEVTALAGPSGCGKSTVLDVLAGLLGDEPGAGGTRVAGSVSGVAAGALAWVPQHPVTIAPTVLEEVLLYARPLPDAEAALVARSVLADAGAAHLADRDPAELSQGELRRVAVARALARVAAGARVVLLDEPTAHLDPGTARAVERAVGSLRGRATVLLVAHDPATLALADTVLRMGPEVSGTEAQAAAGAAGRDGHGAPEDPRRAPAEEPRRDGGPDRTPAGQPGGAEVLRLLAGILRPGLSRLAAAALFGVLASLFAVALAALSGWLIVRASQQPPILYLMTAIVGVRFFGIGRAVLRYLERLWLHDAVFTAMVQLRVRVWDSLAARGLAARRLLRGDRTLEHLIGDVDTVRDLAPRVLLPPLTAALTAAGALIATGLLLPEALPAQLLLAAVALVAAPAAALAADRAASRAEIELRSTVLRSFAGVLAARTDLRANGVDAPVRRRIAATDRAATGAVQRAAAAQGLAQALLLLAGGAAALLTLAAAAPRVASGGVGGEVAAALVLMDLALTDAFAAVVPAVQLWPSLRSAAGRFAGELGPAPAAPGGTAGPAQPQAEERVPVTSLSLESVAARWPDQSAPVFTGVDAEVDGPGWLALTGPSGSGKSTLLAVLLGFLPAEDGVYRINGIPVDAEDATRLRGSMAWCPQEAHLFDSSVRANLLLARPAGSAPEDAELEEVLEKVGLGPVLRSMEGGLDGRIGAGGAFLSGGQRQRLAVARTLLVGADVVLLDEPTAHLDSASAASLMADLRTALAGRIVVLVSHSAPDIAADDARVELGVPAAVPSA